MRNYRTVVWIMFIFFVISFITNILNAIISDVKESYELGLTLTGLLPFAFFIAYGLMSVPAGIMVEKYREKNVLTISFAIITIVSFVFATHPTYPVFMSTLFFLGCGMTLLQVAINPLLRVAGGEEHFAFNSVLAQLVFGLASFLSPYLYSYIVDDTKPHGDVFTRFIRSIAPEDLPWIALYGIFSMTALLMFFITLSMKYPKVMRTNQEKMGSVGTYTSLLKNKWVIAYFIAIFAYVGTEQGIGNWMSQFLQEYHGVDPQTTGAVTVSRFWGMMTLGCLLGLLFLKLFDSRKVLIAFSLAAIICLVIALTASLSVAVYAFPLTGFFASVMWSVIFSLALNSVEEHHGSFSGILCTGIAGGAVIPLIIGGLGELMGLKYGMLFLFVTLGYILSVGFWAKPFINNKRIRLKQ